MNVPEVRQFENLDALISCMGNPVEFAAQLRQLKAAEDKLNEKYKLAGTLAQGESFLAEATAKLDEAKDLRRHAGEILADAKTRAESMVADAHEQVAKIHQDATAAAAAAQAKIQEAAGAMEAARGVEREGQRALSAAQNMQKGAERLKAEAQALQAEYESRLAKMRQLAG